MPILNYTTSVSADRTVAQIQKQLAQHGAKSIAANYDGAGNIAALSFTIQVGEHLYSYRLPVNVDGVAAVLKEQKVEGRYRKHDHVRNVAWRILKSWIEAQLALVEAGQALTQQVFFPYLVAPDGHTLFEHFESDPRRLLTA